MSAEETNSAIEVPPVETASSVSTGPEEPVVVARDEISPEENVQKEEGESNEEGAEAVEGEEGAEGAEGEEFENPEEAEQEPQDVIPERVFVGNLPYEVTEEEVRGLTPDLEIVSVEIPKKQFFNKSMSQPVIQSKGYGFITYTCAEDATSAIESIAGKKIGEREIYAKAAVPQSRSKAHYGYYNNYNDFNNYNYNYNYPGDFNRNHRPHDFRGGHSAQAFNNGDGNVGGNYRYYNRMYYPRGGYYYAPPAAVAGFYRAPYIPRSDYRNGYPGNPLGASPVDNAAGVVGEVGSDANEIEVENGNVVPVAAIPAPGVPLMTDAGVPVGPGPIGVGRPFRQPFHRQQKTKEEKLKKLEEGTPSKTTIFVGNLDRNVTVNDLREFFKDLEPQWIRVPRKTLPKYLYQKFKAQNIQIQNKGIAFIRFANEENQKSAIEKFNGVEFRGKPLNVTVAIDSVPEKEREPKQRSVEVEVENEEESEEVKHEEETSPVEVTEAADEAPEEESQ
ncbi:DEKNAAC105593 [Brettanomyces naardenensis]|uniref:DEKNAAC105593 n=1 Tax=Brettanomyces naardenensis TaxID=13370 RepID=A0A448YU54_BRENA|nr:DEKNAAC105593 [Brettanomyces naardenensis]